jgi:hypothetical protein
MNNSSLAVEGDVGEVFMAAKILKAANHIPASITAFIPTS